MGSRPWMLQLIAGLVMIAAVPAAAQVDSAAAPAAEPVAVEQPNPTEEHAVEGGAPLIDEVRRVVEEYVKQVSEEEGGEFPLEDEQDDTLRMLTLESVGSEMGQYGLGYYIRASMKDAATGDAVDVDFDVEPMGDDTIDVVDVRIYQVNGKPRYAYENNERLPVLQ